MIWLLVACGYPVERFQEDFDEASCQWQADCYDYQSVETCIAESSSSWDGVEACSYDEDAARECVKDTNKMPCPDEEEGVVFPDACAEVWSCGG